jgi:hypothetical protein
MEVAEALALIQRIIEEHRQFIGGFQNLEQLANDSIVMRDLDLSKEAFMPGRLDQKEGLKKLGELLLSISKGLRAHFNREETALPGVVTQYGNKEMASDLRSIFLEHEDLRNRITQAEKHVAELTGGGLTRYVWEATAHDMRAHMTHTRKLLEAHAKIEQTLLRGLEKALKAG